MGFVVGGEVVLPGVPEVPGVLPGEVGPGVVLIPISSQPEITITANMHEITINFRAVFRFTIHLFVYLLITEIF